jgi:DNA-binding winged helix-turn-helix (wHTH) protein
MSSIKVGEWVIFEKKLIIIKNKEEIFIKPLSMKLLSCLIKNDGNLVTKDDLVKECWNGKFVSDDAIRQAVKDLRDYLGCNGYDSVYIETVRGQGYRLIPKVEVLNEFKIKDKLKSKTIIGLFLIILFSIIVIPFFETIGDNYKLSKDSIILTYDKKRELYFDKSNQDWSAYTVLKDGGYFGEKIIIKNSSNEIINTLFPSNIDGHVINPTFSISGEKLAYIDYHVDNCSIKIINPMTNKLLESIACSKSDYLFALDWSSDNELYYSTSTDESLPLSLHFYNTDNKEHHKLTTPELGGRGDYFVRVCEQNILILRNVDYTNTEIILYNILEKKEKLIKRVGEVIISTDWFPNCQNAVIYLKEHGLNKISIKDGKITNIDKNIKDITTLKIKGNYLYASMGSLSNKEVMLISKDLKTEKTIISSNGNNKKFVKNFKNDNFAFISSRTGKDQLWVNNNGKYSQLTKFTKAVNINSVSWSVNKENILYFSEAKNIWSVNIVSNIINLEYTSSNIIKNLTTIDNDNVILYSNYSNGLWQGYSLNLSDKKSKPLSNLSIKEFRKNELNEIYFRLQNDDIYKYKNDIKENLLITKMPSNCIDWIIHKELLHCIYDGKLLEKNINDNSIKTLIKNKNIGTSFSYDSLKGFYFDKNKSGLIDVERFELIKNKI